MKRKALHEFLQKALEIKLLTVVELVEMGSDLGHQADENHIVAEVLEAARFSAHQDEGAKDRQLRDYAKEIGLIPSS